MGRPKGSKNKSTMAKQLKLLEAKAANSAKSAKMADPLKKLSDKQVIDMIIDRFDAMHQFAKGATIGGTRGLIVSGAPGVGKSHTVEFVLEHAGRKMPDFRYTIIKGAVTAVNLYKMLYRFRHENNVIVLDDADSIFFDEDGMSLLKAALDSGTTRKICWLSESASLKAEGIDTEFTYNGGMIFLTNTDMQRIVDEGKSKLANHFEALINRSIYLDLRLHGRRAVALWVSHIVRRSNMFMDKFNLTKADQEAALSYLTNNRDKLRTLSIREALKLAQMIKSFPATWRKTADIVLLRNELH